MMTPTNRRDSGQAFLAAIVRKFTVRRKGSLPRARLSWRHGCKSLLSGGCGGRAEQLLDRPDVKSLSPAEESFGRVKFIDSSVFQGHSVKVGFRERYTEFCVQFP
jgi:hypothetical protein